jgi:hypothetical protein
VNNKIIVLGNLFSNPELSKVFDHGWYWIGNIIFEIDKEPGAMIMLACRGIK